VFIIINDQNITFLGHTGPLVIVWALRPLSIVTIHYFKIRVRNLGCYIPSPLFWNCPQCIYKIEIKISNLFKKLQVLCPHGIFMFPSSIFRTVAGPLNFYQLYNSIPKHFYFFVQYPHWLNLKISLCLYLNQMPINNMVKIMYIFL
jgi:hypothetical protein